MKYETLFNNEKIQTIGFGTWRIGGASSPNLSMDGASLAALRSALALGYTHFDTAEMYGGGHSEELVGQAARESGMDRSKLFITTKVTPSHLRFHDVVHACESSLRRLKMDYLDMYLIHWPSHSIPLEETFQGLNQLVSQGKVRYLGVSNFELDMLQKAQKLCETPIATNQIPYSLFDRSYAKNGVLHYCQESNILVTAYSPVKEGRIKVTHSLQSIATAHDATPYQIALAWLVNQPKVITIPMSFNPQHQAENLAAGEIVLTDDEMDEMA